jgi:hypothetical protein
MTSLRTLAVAALVIAVASTPAHAASKPKPKPITKTYSMQLAPVPDPPQGTSCVETKLEGVAMHTEKLTVKRAGTLSVKVSGFAGDWDITVVDGSDNTVMEVGSGTSTGGGAPATNGVDTVDVKVKKATQFLIHTCNFAGTPAATGSYRFTYT